MISTIKELQNRKLHYNALAAALVMGGWCFLGKSRPAYQLPINTTLFGFAMGVAGSALIQNYFQYLSESRKLDEDNWNIKRASPTNGITTCDIKWILKPSYRTALEQSAIISKRVALAAAFVLAVGNLTQLTYLKTPLSASLQFIILKAIKVEVVAILATFALTYNVSRSTKEVIKALADAAYDKSAYRYV